MSITLIEDFSKHLKENNKSNSTVIAYQKDLEQLLEAVEKELTELAAGDIEAVISDMQQKFTPKTVSRKINSYRTFYKYLQQRGLVANNPANKVDHPQFTPKPPRVLSPMEYLALKEVSRDNPRLYTMIELLLQTGIRIGELSRLKVKHAQLESKHLHIEPYSTNDERLVPLNTKAQEVLSEHRPIRKERPADHPLFATRDGNHIIIRNIRSSIDRAMSKAGIKDAAVNDLRNTFIVMQLKAGVPIDFLAQVVGHRSRTTTNKYLGLLEDSYKPSNDARIVSI